MKTSRNFFSRLLQHKTALIAVAVGVVVLVVGYAILQSGAAGYFGAVEGETGAPQSGAYITSDTSASAGKTLVFAAPTPPGPVTGAGCLITPSACGYPDATNTGVNPNRQLTQSGSMVVTTPNTVIDGVHVTGTVTVRAANVTIRNSKIINPGAGKATVSVESGNVAIVDTTIDGGTSSVAIGNGNFSLTRVNLVGGSDGVRADGNVSIVDSYIHGLRRVPNSHNDSIQTINGHNTTIRHNTIFAFTGAPGTWPSQGDPMNGVFTLGNFVGDTSNVLFEDNLVNGGNYSFGADWKNVDKGLYKVTNIRIINNKMGRDFRYGPAMGLTHGVVFTGNTFIDNGAAIK